MAYLHNTTKVSELDVVIGFNSNADAILRYAETFDVKAAVLIDACSLYTLGERHGRDYRYPWIDSNLKRVLVVSTSPSADDDAKTIYNQLRLIEKTLVTSGDIATSSLALFVKSFITAVQKTNN
jgi:hypothetical protein